MDEVKNRLTVSRLWGHLASSQAPLIVDVRRREVLETSGRMIAGACWRELKEIAVWAPLLDRGRAVLVYCAHGHERGQGVAAALRCLGIAASYLDGGFTAWDEAGAPTIAWHAGADSLEASVWVTREGPKIDRIACPWLIRRFIDPGAIIHFVSPDMVAEAAALFGWEPFDIPDVRLSHRDDACSFDTFLQEFDLRDPCLEALAPIVRGADTARPELAPQASGLLALSLGMSALYPADAELLERGSLLYDALYAWRRDAGDERHNWVGRKLDG
jgi:rhodanese-related sulfurtransferase